jgi:Tfp pilus assembly protein PilN
MAISQSSLGIELRQDRIVVSHLKKLFKQIRVVRSDVLPLPPAKAKEESEIEIINVLQRHLNGNNFPRDNVILALPRERALVKQVEVPAAAKENLRKVLEYELAKHIPFAPEEALFDFQVLEETPTVLRILLVVVKKEDVSRWLDLFRRIGIRPIAIEIATTASTNLFYYDEALSEAPAQVLIEVGERFFELLFFEKGEFKERAHFLFRGEAERDREIAEAYRLARLKGLGVTDGKGDLLVCGDSTDEALIEKLKETISDRIKPVQSFKKIESPNSGQRVGEYYASIGLALRGLARTKWNINLTPVEMRKKVSRFGYYLALFLTMVSIVLAGALAVHPYLQEREELNQVLLEIKAKKPEVEAIEALQKKKELMEKEIREFETLRADEASRLEILKELSEILPQTAWLWNVKVKAREVDLSGFADSASDLIAILDKSPVFEKVEFASPVTKETRLFGPNVVKERFKITARIEKAR